MGVIMFLEPQETMLQRLKRQIKEAQEDAEMEAEGGIVDLCRIFSRIIHNFEHKGQEYVVKRYWRGN